MKRISTLALATVSTLTAASALAAPSANASTAPHQYTSDNITITWGDSVNLDDLSIEETPGAKPSSTSPEDKKIGQQILYAYLQTTAATPKGKDLVNSYAAAASDYCTWSPDSYGKASFKPACASHDSCYSKSSTTPRLTCDNRFKDALNKACNTSFNSWWEAVDRKACNGVAWMYYQAVRKAGKSHYHGRASNA